MKRTMYMGWLLVLSSLFIASCNRDFDLEREELKPLTGKTTVPSRQSLAEFQTLFEQGYVEEKVEALQVEDSSQDRKSISFLGLKPQWALAKEFNWDGSTLLKVVPLKADDALLRIADGVEEFDQETMKKYRSQINRPYLVQTKSKDTHTDGAYFALLIPNRDYILSGKGLDQPDGIIPTEFDGIVILYDLKGAPRYLYNFVEGKFRGIWAYRQREGAQLAGWDGEICYWVTRGIIEQPSEEDPIGGVGVESTWTCDPVYIPERTNHGPGLGRDTQRMQDWINNGGGGGGGRALPPSKKIASKEEIEKKMNTPEVDALIQDLISVAKAKSTSEYGVEAGVWIYEDADGSLHFGEMHTGDPVANVKGKKANIDPGDPKSKARRGNVPKTAKPYVYVHVHRSMENFPEEVKREVGLSGADSTWADQSKFPIIAIDDEGVLYEDGKRYWRSGEPFRKPKKYIYSPRDKK